MAQSSNIFGMHLKKDCEPCTLQNVVNYVPHYHQALPIEKVVVIAGDAFCIFQGEKKNMAKQWF